MKQHFEPNRRGFFSAASLGALALGGAATRAQAAAPEKKPNKKTLKLGLASYSTRKFSLDDTIKMALELDVPYIALKSFHLELDSTPAERKEAAKKIKDAGLMLMGGGVITLKNDEKNCRDAFEYGKDAGMPTLIISPDPEALPIIDKLVKEYNIQAAIHNHGPGDQKFPSPFDVYKAVQPYDKRLGLCMDVGHTARWGDDEVAAIYATKDRLLDFHIKDTSKRAADGSTLEMGRGVVRLPEVMKALMDIGYEGHVALEYEKDESAPMPGMRESIGYARGIMDTLNM